LVLGFINPADFFVDAPGGGKMALNVDCKSGEKVIDPFKHKERFQKNGLVVEGVSERNTELIKAYVQDMSNGMNVGGNRGYRGYNRLLTLKYRLRTIALWFEQHRSKNLDCLSFEDAHDIFRKLYDGGIKKHNGAAYSDIASYTKDFRAFWHWHQRVLRKQGKEVPDIALDLHFKTEKPKFTYFTFDDLKRMCDHAKYKYRVLMWFMFDAGIRSPTELMNVKRKDLTWDDKQGVFTLNIREETSKTFGRKIKLLLCSDMLKRHMAENGLKSDDFVFDICPAVVNQTLKRLGNRILGKDNLTMYDFRHSSACYWLPRYKSESALKYRFGWKQSEMIHYYTEFMGMKDTITESDLVDADEKTLMQKQLDEGNVTRQLMEERMKALEQQLQTMQELLVKQKAAELQQAYPREALMKN
jgi:integrase